MGGQQQLGVFAQQPAGPCIPRPGTGLWAAGRPSYWPAVPAGPPSLSFSLSSTSESPQTPCYISVCSKCLEGLLFPALTYDWHTRVLSFWDSTPMGCLAPLGRGVEYEGGTLPVLG